MQLEKDGRTYNTNNENVIVAYKEAGWTEAKAKAPAKAPAKASKEKK